MLSFGRGQGMRLAGNSRKLVTAPVTVICSFCLILVAFVKYSIFHIRNQPLAPVDKAWSALHPYREFRPRTGPSYSGFELPNNVNLPHPTTHLSTTHLSASPGLSAFESEQSTIVDLLKGASLTDPVADATLERRAAAVAKIANLTRESRIRLLQRSLVQWKTGSMPTAIAIIAAASAPSDAVSAVLGLVAGESPSRNRDTVVVDVGANQGWPVTRYALTSAVAHVVSFEPDPRNYRVLSMLPYPGRRSTKNSGHQAQDSEIVKHGSSDFRKKFIPMQCAAGRQPGKANMSFHKLRNDFSCFGCLDTSGAKPEVYRAEVEVCSIDNALSQKAGISDNVGVLLLKTDTQGYETEVLLGAKRLLDQSRVEHLITEFDPRLLRSVESALNLLKVLADAGMECAHLGFSGVSGSQQTEDSSADYKHHLFYPLPRNANESNGRGFISFVRSTGGWTDLFCVKRCGMSPCPFQHNS